MSWFIQTCRSSLGKKYIMALTGFMLGGFLLVHTIGNSTIFWGRSAFNAYAHHLHSLGIFVPIFEIGLYSIFFLHVFVGITLFLRLAQALIRPHKVHFPCDRCGLQNHDPDAVHCKACGNLLCIPDED